MRVKFLGTGTDSKTPVLTADTYGNLAFDDCDVCGRAIKDPSRRRRPSSIYLYGYGLLVDMPPEINLMAREYLMGNPIDHVFFTHAHNDHRSGCQDLFKYYVKKKESGLRTSYYATNKVAKRLRNQGSYLFEKGTHNGKTSPPIVDLTEFSRDWAYSLKNLFRKRKYRQVELDGLAILPLKVIHEIYSADKDTDTVGFLFKEDRKGLLYIPDLEAIPTDSLETLLEERKKLDRLAFVSGVGGMEGRHGHAGMKDILKLAKLLRATDVYFTHVSHRTDPDNIPAEIKDAFPDFKFAYDGLEIEV